MRLSSTVMKRHGPSSEGKHRRTNHLPGGWMPADFEDVVWIHGSVGITRSWGHSGAILRGQLIDS